MWEWWCTGDSFSVSIFFRWTYCSFVVMSDTMSACDALTISGCEHYKLYFIWTLLFSQLLINQTLNTDIFVSCPHPMTSLLLWTRDLKLFTVTSWTVKNQHPCLDIRCPFMSHDDYILILTFIAICEARLARCSFIHYMYVYNNIIILLLLLLILHVFRSPLCRYHWRGGGGSLGLVMQCVSHVCHLHFHCLSGWLEANFGRLTGKSWWTCGWDRVAANLMLNYDPVAWSGRTQSVPVDQHSNTFHWVIMPH